MHLFQAMANDFKSVAVTNRNNKSTSDGHSDDINCDSNNTTPDSSSKDSPARPTPDTSHTEPDNRSGGINSGGTQLPHSSAAQSHLGSTPGQQYLSVPGTLKEEFDDYMKEITNLDNGVMVIQSIS